MSIGVYANEPWLSIQRTASSHCVYAEWKGFANSVDFRASLMKIFDAIRDKRSASLVSDNRRLEGVANQDQLWIRDTGTSLALVFATRTFTPVSEAMDWVVDHEELSKGLLGESGVCRIS